MDKTFRMSLVRLRHDGMSGPEHLLCLPVMEHLRGEQADPRVPMFLVIPSEKGLAESPGILDAAETFRKIRSILKGFELRLRKGVVIAGVGSAVRFGDAQIGQEEGHGFRSHG